ncbi:ATP-dependent 6-phosphofructokinase 6-like protein [Tanacetum coccineum]
MQYPIRYVMDFCFGFYLYEILNARGGKIGGSDKLDNGSKWVFFVDVGCKVKLLFVDADDTVPQVYFAPDEVHAAIVTCGGLCPGLDTVIREIVCALYHMYGVTKVLGIDHAGVLLDDLLVVQDLATAESLK